MGQIHLNHVQKENFEMAHAQVEIRRRNITDQPEQELEEPALKAASLFLRGTLLRNAYDSFELAQQQVLDGPTVSLDMINDFQAAWDSVENRGARDSAELALRRLQDGLREAANGPDEWKFPNAKVRSEKLTQLAFVLIALRQSSL